MSTCSLRLLIALSAMVGLQAFAANSVEPKFCNPANFQKYERKNNIPGLERAHVYQVGSLTLVGLAVGDTDVRATKALALQYSKYSASQNYCTWYYNDGNPEAISAFNHYYLPIPLFWNSKEKMGNVYEERLGDTFDIAPINMVDCAVKNKYIAMGCDGMKHRGPSSFAMFLSFAGCSPESSVKIVNNIWGKNGVQKAMRIEIAERGYNLGSEQPAARRALQAQMGY